MELELLVICPGCGEKQEADNNGCNACGYEGGDGGRIQSVGELLAAKSYPEDGNLELNSVSPAFIRALIEAARPSTQERGEAVAWVTDEDVRDFGKGPGESIFMFAKGGRWNIPLYAAPTAAQSRIAELEAQLAHVTALHRNAAKTLDVVLETRRSVERELTESREREAKLIADLDANLEAFSDERKRALSAESLARELHELLADYVSQDSIAQGYGAGIGGTTYEKAEAFLDALAAEKGG